MHITSHIDDRWIAWIVFDAAGEKVNTLSSAAMAELDAIVAQLAEDERIKAVAIRSGKPESFIVGADIAELAAIEDTHEAREKARLGRAIFDRIEQLPVPTVAAIDGTCLGGGLEMALACDYRIVTDHPRTSLGLPEVKLGILPGWGGTQRLPRLIGLAPALAMILTGKSVDGRKARRIGLADAIAAPAFLESATADLIEAVLTRGGHRRVVRQRKKARRGILAKLERTAAGRLFICRQASKSIHRKSGTHYPAPLEALDVIRRTCCKRDLVRGFEIETEGFCRLAGSAESRHLVWLFQASQRAKKVSVDAKPRPVDRAAVVGAGIMGSGIAWALSNAGLPVRLKDIDWAAVAKGMSACRRTFDAAVQRRRMSRPEMTVAMHRIAPAVDQSGFGNLDIVIEAVAEDLTLKRKVLQEIENSVRPDTVIATNTSSLPLADLGSALSNPKRFVALHFFNPVNRMPLVEVVPARRTSPQTVATVLALMQRLGKTAVLVGDCPGFLVNRILLPYLVEAAWMVEQGVSPRRIDRVLEAFGMPMGPLALADEVGLDVGGKVALVLSDAYGARMRVPTLLSSAVESGELKGRKNGEGFYRYDSKKRRENRRIAALAAEARHRDGVPHLEKPSASEIRDRAVLIMVNEAARCLEESVAAGAETLDIAMVMGTGFAPFRGGLLRYADDRGLHEIKQRLDELSLSCGERFRPAPLLMKLARDGGRFHEDASAAGAVGGKRNGSVKPVRAPASAVVIENGHGRGSLKEAGSSVEGVR